LASLPEEDFQRIALHLKRINLTLGQVVHESGGHISDVFLPTTAIMLKLYQLTDGGSAEIAVIGNEGVAGVALFMVGKTTIT
jgi:hypothetical protein